MSVLYNEIEPYACDWLENLVSAGHIAQGTVERRSIRDLTPDDLRGAVQAHFFAGIGVWSHALRTAGWPDDVPVWTGSCPCQPFSQAGKKKGFDDDRHLWPEWFRLIRECRPPCLFGEQVAGKDGLAWLDAVQADLEGAGYAFAAFDLCAASVGAPHIRQRLYFFAVRLDALADDQVRRLIEGSALGGRAARGDGTRSADRSVVGDAGCEGSGRDARAVPGAQGEGASGGSRAGDLVDLALDAGAARDVGDTDREREGTVVGVSGGSSAERARGAVLVGDADAARPEGRRSRVRLERRDAGRGGEEGSARGAGAPGGVADGARDGRIEERPHAGGRGEGGGAEGVGERSADGGDGSALADHDEAGLGVVGGDGLRGERDASLGDDAHGRGEARALADHELHDGAGRVDQPHGRAPVEPHRHGDARGATAGFWDPCEWVACRDGKLRPVEPGTFPLAHGAPARVGRLRAYGNAIVAPLATEFIRAVLEVFE